MINRLTASALLCFLGAIAVAAVAVVRAAGGDLHQARYGPIALLALISLSLLWSGTQRLKRTEP